MNLYKNILQDYDTTFIYIECHRDEIQNREINRGDRIKGTSLSLLDKFETKEMHNIIIDSTGYTPRNSQENEFGYIVTRLNQLNIYIIIWRYKIHDVSKC
jgi:hypothetical protein